MLSVASGLWPFFFSSLGLAFFYDFASTKKEGKLGEKIYVKKNKFFFLILAVACSVFIGLRNWCNDTGTYREIFDYLTSSSGSIFQGIDWSLGQSPGYSILNAVMKHLGFSAQDHFMFYSFLTNCIYIWFLRKYSSDFSLTFFLFWAIGCYMFTAAAMRQCIAIAFCLIGTDMALKKKYLSFLFWIVVATTFHMYALIYLIVPFVFFKPWTKKTWFLLFASAVAGVMLQFAVGTLINVAGMMGKSYRENEFSGEGVNIFRLLVTWAPIALSFLAKNKISESNDKEDNVFMNLSTVNAAIMFIALFGTANYFARLANYFQIFQPLAIPWMLKYFDKSTRAWLKPVIYICYTAYFLYTYLIYSPFNSYFDKMTLMEYIQMH